MSQNQPFHARNPLMSSSSMFFSNSSSKNNNYPFQPPAYNPPFKDFSDASSTDTFQPRPMRTAISQSVIFSPQTETKPKFSGLSKLESMARHVPGVQNDDFHSQKPQNNVEPQFSKDPFSSKEPSPYASQVGFGKNPFAFTLNDQAKRVSTEPAEPVKRRRESVDLDNINRQGGAVADNLKFLQRGSHIFKEKQPTEKPGDCQSTNSGSGNELLKPRNFDFLKKRKEPVEAQLPNSQSLKQFHPLKKSEHIWPLSISPMQQKSPTVVPKQRDEEPASASKLQYRHKQPDLNYNSFSSIEFKKKKLMETPMEIGKQLNYSPEVVRPKEEITLRGKMSMKPQREIKIEDFQIMDKLGKGAFGEVFVAQEKNLGWMCVIKKMSKKRIREAKVEEHIIREIKLQTYLNHSHLTALYGYFHDEDHLYLILELLPDGSLQQVKKKRKLPEKEATDIVRQVAEGLKYMHEEYVIHRDLKPQNLFINQGYIKLGDFGCSIYHNETGLRNTIVGCLEYSSPEQLCKEGYSDKIDAWSLGILTYELLFGKSPFESEIKKIVRSNDSKPELSEVSFPSAPPISEEGKSFILNLLENDPNCRMDMDEVLAHPFLKTEEKRQKLRL